MLHTHVTALNGSSPSALGKVFLSPTSIENVTCRVKKGAVSLLSGLTTDIQSPVKSPQALYHTHLSSFCQEFVKKSHELSHFAKKTCWPALPSFRGDTMSTMFTQAASLGWLSLEWTAALAPKCPSDKTHSSVHVGCCTRRATWVARLQRPRSNKIITRPSLNDMTLYFPIAMSAGFKSF